MTFKTSTVFKAALATVFAGTATLAGVAASNAQAPGQGWYKVCTKQEDNDVCVVQNIIQAQTGQLVTAVGLVTVEGKVNRRAMQVTVPPARLIPPGIQLQIDGGEAQRLPYTICMPDKCVAEVQLTDGIINSMKRGGEAVFTSINYQRAPNPIKISLSGFTAAFDGPPVEQSDLQASQQKLQEEMQKKIQAERMKLEEAQKKAIEESN